MLAAICAYFNPCGYQKILDNFLVFRENFTGCDLFVIELSFDDHFQTSPSFAIRGDLQNFMWQKEAMLNEAVARLPPQYDTVAWIDADILFQNRKWALEVERAIQEKSIVQLFDNVWLTKQNGAIDASQSRSSFVSSIQCTSDTIVGGCVGYGWAAPRRFFRQHGLASCHILGGADAMLTAALVGNFGLLKTRSMSRPLDDWFQLWAKPIYEEYCDNVKCLSGEIIHLYHGKHRHRRYVERWNILRNHRFDPLQDVSITGDGIMKWDSCKPMLHRDVRRYFTSRADDSHIIESQQPR